MVMCMKHSFLYKYSSVLNPFIISVINGEGNQRTYTSKADIRKNIRRMRNGPGRNQGMGGRVEKSKGFSPNSFDRVLLDAPCSALGLRPRLFAGEVGSFFIGICLLIIFIYSFSFTVFFKQWACIESCGTIKI